MIMDICHFYSFSKSIKQLRAKQNICHMGMLLHVLQDVLQGLLSNELHVIYYKKCKKKYTCSTTLCYRTYKRICYRMSYRFVV